MIHLYRGAKLCVVKKKVKKIEDMVYNVMNAPIIAREFNSSFFITSTIIAYE